VGAGDPGLSLGDRFAVCGFSGVRRLRADLRCVNSFDEPYDAAVRGRIEAIEVHDYVGHIFGDVSPGCFAARRYLSTRSF
jgi:hypothetical protein